MFLTPRLYCALAALLPVTALMAQTNPSTTTSIDQSIASPLTPFGSTSTNILDYSARNTTTTDLAGTRAIVRHTTGSGTFGPAQADYGLFVSASKDGWQDPSGGPIADEGEVDGAFMVARQGKKGDTAALLIDVVKRRDALTTIANDETGAGMAIESGTSLMDASGTVYHTLHAISAFAESGPGNGSPGGVSGGRGYGHWVHAEKGQWFSGYHAEEKSGVGSFVNYFSGSKDDTPGGVNFAVRHDGVIEQGVPTAQIRFGYDSGGNVWRMEDEGGNYLFSIGRSSKVAHVANGFAIGSGSTVTYLKAAAGTAAVPSLAPQTSATIVSGLTVTGAAVGDMVTVAVTSTAPGYIGLRLSGVVTAADTVRIDALNLGSATGGGYNVDYAVKVERFQ